MILSIVRPALPLAVAALTLTACVADLGCDAPSAAAGNSADTGAQ